MQFLEFNEDVDMNNLRLKVGMRFIRSCLERHLGNVVCVEGMI